MTESVEESPVSDDEYRKMLYEREYDAQKQFDKTVLTLSSSAIAISFAFINDFIAVGGIKSPNILFAAWISWGVSVACILISFYTANNSYRNAIIKFNKGVRDYNELAGTSEQATACLNFVGGFLFVTGLFFIGIFLYKNVGFVNG